MSSSAPTEIADQVPTDCAGAREIGFSIPTVYNASRVLFDNLDKGHGDRLALTGPLGAVSYGELCSEASRWGHGLISLGLKRGDRVLMFLDDTPAYAAAFFGAVRAGFVPLLINTLTPPDLLQFTFRIPLLLLPSQMPSFARASTRSPARTPRYIR
jgi:non-ribosomal peptide synthetase component F